MEALSDEWVPQDVKTAPKAYSLRSCGNCIITFRQTGKECFCYQEVNKCEQSLSNEWVPQGLETPKCISDLNLSGKWLSCGGDTKEFIHRDFILKWQGKSNARLTIVKDNDENYPENGLKRYAKDSADKITFSSDETSDDELHVVEEIPDQVNNVDENIPSCLRNEISQPNLNKLLSIITDLKDTQEKERQLAIAQAAKFEATNKELISNQTKMAAEIQELKSTVIKLEHENNAIKMVLDIRQDEWQKVEARKGSSLKQDEKKYTTPVQNSFTGLEIEDTSLTCFPEIAEYNSHSETLIHKIKEYPPKESTSTKKSTKRSVSSKTQTPKSKEHTCPDERITLVIGDSMIKNINRMKIERASGNKSVCHSYSGARVKQIEEKLKNDGDGQYDGIILHVGTNDLAHSDAEQVAKDMDSLPQETKTHTKKIAVSNIIKRYDGKVHSDKIDHYNKLLENLCLKHNVTLISNDNIDESRLNGSNLHLNRFGDIALGSAFCSYLKSFRAKTQKALQGNVNRDRNNFLFKIHARRSRDWPVHLNLVRRMMT